MGFRASDIDVISSTGPTVLIPTSKDLVVKAFSVPRTQTVAALEAVLPADASIVEITSAAGVASDAATTATVTITVADNSGTISTGVFNAKTNGAIATLVPQSALPNIQPSPLNGDLRISAVYAETGTASTTGGPWVFFVKYVR